MTLFDCGGWQARLRVDSCCWLVGLACFPRAGYFQVFLPLLRIQIRAPYAQR